MAEATETGEDTLLRQAKPREPGGLTGGTGFAGDYTGMAERAEPAALAAVRAFRG